MTLVQNYTNIVSAGWGTPLLTVIFLLEDIDNNLGFRCRPTCMEMCAKEVRKIDVNLINFV